MTHRYPQTGISLLAVVLLSTACRAATIERDSRTPFPLTDTLDLAGCYELVLRITAGDASQLAIERRVWLTGMALERSEPFNHQVYVVKPAPGTAASEFEGTTWMVAGFGTDSVRVFLRWSNFFYGVHVDLVADSARNRLVGSASTFTDVLGEPPSRAEVVARPVDCFPRPPVPQERSSRPAG